MSIAFTRYVDITSGIIAAPAVADRALCLRLFSTNPLIPTNSFAEFSNADDVAAYFGATSYEYYRAAFYFSFISKTATSPTLISFASWVENSTAPVIYGSASELAPLATLQAAGSMTLGISIAGQNAAVAMNFAGAASYAAIATIIQGDLRAAGGANFATLTCVYNAQRGAFVITGGAVATTGPITISVLPESGVDAGALLGFEAIDTIVSEGAVASSLTETMIASTDASNNFASFAFMPTLTQAQIVELATWVATTNFTYEFLVPVNANTAAQISAAIIDLPGCGLTLSPLLSAYPELLPGMILAATDYTKRNVSQNYMYQSASLTPSVLTDSDADAYDAIRTNYYGQTQTAGKLISFYQRGVLTGNPLEGAATDMNVYANEIWFKNHIGDDLFDLLLAVTQIPTTAVGKSMVLAVIQAAVEDALYNGTISPGQTLTAVQQQVILQMTDDPTAYLQIQTIGYWVDVEFQSVQTTDNRTEWNAVYTLLYTKNNAVRKVVGTHGLI